MCCARPIAPMSYACLLHLYESLSHSPQVFEAAATVLPHCHSFSETWQTYPLQYLSCASALLAVGLTWVGSVWQTAAMTGACRYLSHDWTAPSSAAARPPRCLPFFRQPLMQSVSWQFHFETVWMLWYHTPNQKCTKGLGFIGSYVVSRKDFKLLLFVPAFQVRRATIESQCLGLSRQVGRSKVWLSRVRDACPSSRHGAALRTRI